MTRLDPFTAEQRATTLRELAERGLDAERAVTGPFLKRVSEAGLSRDDYEIEMEGGK